MENPTHSFSPVFSAPALTADASKQLSLGSGNWCVDDFKASKEKYHQRETTAGSDKLSKLFLSNARAQKLKEMRKKCADEITETILEGR